MREVNRNKFVKGSIAKKMEENKKQTEKVQKHMPVNKASKKN